LENAVYEVLSDMESGAVARPDEPVTPHRIGLLLVEQNKTDKAPSTGAVAAVLDRWVKIGAIVTSTKPYAWVGFTDAARNDGIAALKKAAKPAPATPEAPAPAAPEATDGE
jgi:hypothetical protein